MPRGSLGRGRFVKRWIPTLVATLLTVVVTVWATRTLVEGPVLDERVVHGTVRSRVLGEEREFFVSLPESYAREPARGYPVIYVLDGASQHAHTSDSAALLARIGVIPEVLVIGAPPVDGQGRKRDYTPPGMRQDADVTKGPEGGADRFLAFLEEELIPRIERDYRTRGPRVLAGNSRGGLFVVYSLLAEPALFDARLAFSPALWRDDDAIATRLDRFLASSPSLGGFLYLSLGEGENEKMTAAFERTVAVLERRAPRALRWRAELTRGGDHGNNALLSTPVGLYALFAEASSSPRL
jgi:hypothetical protein